MMKNSFYNNRVKPLVDANLAKVVTFTISDAELQTEYHRLCNSYTSIEYRTPYNKKNVAQTIIRRKIREKYAGWCEIRFTYVSSSIWYTGNRFQIVIKPAYKRHEMYP